MTTKQNIIRDAKLKLCPYMMLTCTHLNCHGFTIKKIGIRTWAECDAIGKQITESYNRDDDHK